MPVLTHDMVRRDGTWRCVDCGRTGTITVINQVECPRRGKGTANLLDAIEGKGAFAKIEKK